MGKLTEAESTEMLALVIEIVKAETKCQRTRDAMIVRECIAEAVKQGSNDLLAIAGAIMLQIEVQPDRVSEHVRAALRELAKERAEEN